MALEMQRLGALGLEKRVGKSILGKVPDMPGSEPSLSKPGAPAFPSPTGGPGARGAASASWRLGRHLLCAAGAPGHGALPRGGALLREGRGLGPRICHVPPAARGRPGRAGGHRGPGAHVLAAAASHPARHLSAGERAGVPEARAPRQPHPVRPGGRGHPVSPTPSQRPGRPVSPHPVPEAHAVDGGRPRTGTGLRGAPAGGMERSGRRGPQSAACSLGESRGPAVHACGPSVAPGPPDLVAGAAEGRAAGCGRAQAASPPCGPRGWGHQTGRRREALQGPSFIYISK